MLALGSQSSNKLRSTANSLVYDSCRPVLAACARCRLKKLKCDTRRPRCGTCVGADAVCEPTVPGSHRGPRKGHVRCLQDKIASLEKELDVLAKATPSVPVDYSGGNVVCSDPSNGGESTATSLSTTATQSAQQPVVLGHTDPATGPSGAHADDAVHMPHLQAFCYQGDPGAASLATASPLLSDAFAPSDLLQSDLNQIYFERLHPSLPILHRRRYFTWAQASSKAPAQTCLQYAMWTVAASLSSPLQPIAQSLYLTTQMLLAASEDPFNPGAIEYVQARLLISLYVFINQSHRQGWITAGQCFRIVQLMGLHQLDDPLHPHDTQGDSWFAVEERRRVFWTAYCLDVLVSKRGQWPLTLHEHVRCTRTPLPDEAFQNEEPYETPYLHEVLGSHGDSALHYSPCLELIIFCTISRKIASLKRNDLRFHGSIKPTSALFQQFCDLASMLKLHTEDLSMRFPVDVCWSDPIILFTSMFAHALSLCLCSCLTKAMPEEREDYLDQIETFRQRGLDSVMGITSLATHVASLSYFKMHPFTPLALAICRDFINTRDHVGNEAFNKSFLELSHLLQDMGNVNSIAREYLIEMRPYPVDAATANDEAR